ncbi:hypothetical protein JZ751_013663 [Albula glossodonta]|uniref:Kelch-like protein 20 n=1 Tax=Albula glossodonta TaxID=121402 RepID=A0A8T2P4B7_9TELE|nr:hypothetical protein JZ751_013663 [Albula glossodonta]
MHRGYSIQNSLSQWSPTVNSTSSQQKRMYRAAFCCELKKPLVVKDVPSDQLKPAEVRVEVYFCGVNFADILTCQGLYQERPPLPFTPGPEVTAVQKGDRVIGLGGKAMAEECVVDQKLLWKIPDNVSYEDAAALPASYGTAILGLQHRAKTQPGETVLVTAAAGAAGLAAIDIASNVLKARVISAAGSEEKCALAEKRGASASINYTSSNLKDELKKITSNRGVNVAFEAVGGDIFKSALSCLSWEGRIVVVGFAGGNIPTIPANLLLLKNIAAMGVFWGRYRDEDFPVFSKSISEAIQYCQAGVIKPWIGATFKLHQVNDAFQYIQQRQSVGKVILSMKGTSARPDTTGMDITSRCTLGDPNKLPEGVPQPARMPYVSDKHPRQTLEVINLLRKHRELCDVVLVVGAKKIYAHRVILSACSPYFRAMFTGELAESRQTEVVIRDIDERAMELLIDFAYTSQVTVEEGNVQTLLPAACLLQLAEIQEACCDEEFMLLPANQLIDIISSDELNVRSEEQVFNAVMAWVKYSIQERRPQLPQVLQHVRLPLLSPKFLVGTVGSDPLIKSDEECRDLVDEAKNYLLLPQERPLMQGPRTRPRKPIRCGEVLFAVGGWCSGDAISSVERYDPQTNEWRMVASMSKRRCGVGVSVLDDLLYAVGGHDGSSYLNSVERYDPKTNQWSSDVAPTSTCRTSVGVAVLGGYLYAVGGQDGVSCLNIVERYDPKENKWTRVASMSTRRLGVAVAVLGGFLYAVGGSDGTSPLNTVERYNPQENRWHTVAPMGTRRKHLGCAVYQDMIYSVGGRDDTTELSSAERYNPRTNQLYGGMNYRRLGGGVGVIKMTHCESHIW